CRECNYGTLIGTRAPAAPVRDAEFAPGWQVRDDRVDVVRFQVVVETVRLDNEQLVRDPGHDWEHRVHVVSNGEREHDVVALDVTIWIDDVLLVERNPRCAVERVDGIRQLNEEGVVLVAVHHPRPASPRSPADFAEVRAEIENTPSGKRDSVEDLLA